MEETLSPLLKTGGMLAAEMASIILLNTGGMVQQRKAITAAAQPYTLRNGGRA